MQKRIVHFDVPVPEKLCRIAEILFDKEPQTEVVPAEVVALTEVEDRRRETILMLVGGAIAVTLAGLAAAAAVVEIRRNRREAEEKEKAAAGATTADYAGDVEAPAEPEENEPA